MIADTVGGGGGQIWYFIVVSAAEKINRVHYEMRTGEEQQYTMMMN